MKLSPSEKKLTLDSGTEISFDKCLLATGGRPKTLPVFSEASDDLKSKISLYRGIPDFQRLDDLVGKVESVLVVGGGFLGSELAVGMASRGKNYFLSLGIPYRNWCTKMNCGYGTVCTKSLLQ